MLSGSVIAGGGGTGSDSQYRLSGTVGQHLAGTQTDGRLAMSGGFWSLLWEPSPAPSASTNVLYWTNIHNGSWSVASNWSPNRAPGINDAAILAAPGNYTVSLDTDSSVQRLTVRPGATVAGPGALSIHGPLIWTGGKLSTLVQCNGGSIEGTNTHTLSGGALVNQGELMVQAGISTAGAALITNLPGAVLQLMEAADITYTSGAYGAIHNQGLLRKRGVGVSTIGEIVTNSGVMDARGGMLVLTRPCVQQSGSTRVLEGELQVSGGLLVAGGLLAGTNLVTGNVTNSGGIVKPGAPSGTLSIKGRYVQAAGGSLAIEIGGPKAGVDFDVLSVDGGVQLDGSLAVASVNGFTPSGGMMLDFLPAASCGGTFATFAPPLDTLGLQILYYSDHAALTASGPIQPPPLPEYSIQELVGWDGVGAAPTAINNQGQVAGFSHFLPAGGYHAFVWDQGKITDLGTLAGSTNFVSYAYGINDAGHVVGWSTPAASPAEFHAFFYDGAMHDLGTLGAANQSSYAYGINNHDDVVGYSGVMVYGGTSTHPFLYRSGSMIDLHSPFFPGNTNAGAFAYGLNDSLQVVGYGPRPVGSGHGFLYDYLASSVADIPDLGGVNGSGAAAINNSGQVTGWAYVDGNLAVHAFLFDGRIHDLGTLGGPNSRGFAINSKGEVVGRSAYPGGDPHAFLYTGGHMFDLNDALPSNSGWNLREATGINDLGQIVGNAYRYGAGRGFLLTPLSALKPTLSVHVRTTPSQSEIILSWPLSAARCQLEAAPGLGLPGSWTPVPPALYNTNGSLLQYSEPMPVPGSKFYRLHRP